MAAQPSPRARISNMVRSSSAVKCENEVAGLKLFNQRSFIYHPHVQARLFALGERSHNIDFRCCDQQRTCLALRPLREFLERKIKFGCAFCFAISFKIESSSSSHLPFRIPGRAEAIHFCLHCAFDRVCTSADIDFQFFTPSFSTAYKHPKKQ